MPTGRLYIQAGKGRRNGAVLAILKHRARRFLGILLDSKAMGKEQCEDFSNFGHQKHMENWLLRMAAKETGELPLASSAWKGRERAEEHWPPQNSSRRDP